MKAAGALAIAALACVVLLQYDPAEYPLLEDRAYFVCLGQLVLRGESIYSNTFMGYPALGPLLSAASMWVGRGFDVPTYLAPRYLAVAVSVLCVVLIHLVARRATGCAWAGWVAGLVLLGSPLFGRMSVGTLEPKLLVALFTLLGGAALQRRRWWAAGLASGLAAACWQPALLFVPVSLAVSLWGGRARPGRTCASYAAGVALGVLPVIVYLAAMDAWWDFWQRSVVIPASSQLPRAGADPTRWLASLQRGLARELPFFVGAGAGFAWHAVDALRGGLRGTLRAGLDPRSAGFPLLAPLWAGFNSADFQGLPDMLPLLPSIAFWAAWLSHRLIGLVVSGAPRVGWGRGAGALGAATGLFVLAVTAAYAFPPAFRFALRPADTLSREKAEVARILRAAGPGDSLRGYGAEGVFAIAERRSPDPLLRLNYTFEKFLHLIGLRGCEDFVRRTIGAHPRVVVISTRRFAQGRCAERLERHLFDWGYTARVVSFSSQTWRVLERRPR